jgi:SAM-dependent methyltransferase
LAAHYDGLMEEFGYERYAEYLLSLIGERRRVLDLACGTGRLAEILAGHGCDVVAVDASPEMLSVAMGREIPGVQFIRQDMAELDLFGTVEAAFCTLDALNYLKTPEKLRETFRRVRLFTEPGGVFIFDMLTPKALKARDGEAFMSDSKDAYCVWRCRFEEPFCRQEVTLFTKRRGNLWERRREIHTERAFPLEDVEAALLGAGFAAVTQYGLLTYDAPSEGADRVVFIAAAPEG